MGNRVLMPFDTMEKITRRPESPAQLVAKWLDFSSSALKAFELFIMSRNNKNPIFYTSFELIEQSDLPEDALEEIIGDGQVLKSSFPDKNKDQTYALRSILLHPQIKYVNGDMFADLYIEQFDESDDEYFRTLSHQQMTNRGVLTMLLWDYVNSTLKKECHRIKKLMPTPEISESANKANKTWYSRAITIKDITVQYVYEPHPTRKYKRHCEAWGVRGHYRHYKNGKVVYIAPHMKGAGKIKTTTYVIKASEDFS